jgi:hypothetical protein
MAKQWSTPPEMQIDPKKKYKAHTSDLHPYYRLIWWILRVILLFQLLEN